MSSGLWEENTLGCPLICMHVVGGIQVQGSLSLSCFISKVGITATLQSHWKNSVSQRTYHCFINSTANTKANYCFPHYGWYLYLHQAHRDYWIKNANYDCPPRVYVKALSFKDSQYILLPQNTKETLNSYLLSSSYNWLWDKSCFVNLPPQSLNKRWVNNNDKKKEKAQCILSWILPTQTLLLVSLWEWSLWIPTSGKKNVSYVESSIVDKEAN